MGPLRYLALRLLMLVPVLIGITLLTFTISHVITGDPSRMLVGEGSKQEALDQVRREYGLDQPLHIQYVMYMSNLVQGNLGRSFATRQSVNESFRVYFPATVELGIAALVLAIVMGCALGILSAVTRGSILDHFVRFVAVSGVSLPSFWLGLVLLVIFYLWMSVLPGPGRMDLGVQIPQRITGMYTVDSLLTGNMPAFWSAFRHLILPAFVLAFGHMASIARVLRASMLDSLMQDYIRTARAKGVAERVVILRHAMRNALIPTVTIIGLQVGGLLEGAVLVETVFAWPGIGKYAVDAIRYLDYPVIMGFTVVAATIFVVINLLVDVLYTVLDPRIQLAN